MLLTRDVEGANGKLAGWQFEGMLMEGGVYWMKSGEQPVGGIVNR